MSGSTIGGVVGYAIGFYFGGPAGGQVGWMIGSAVGGYVDPEIIKGQRLTDAQQQTSMEGASRSIIYGTATVAGNVIQTGPLIERKHRERTGKGGPVQESYTYSRSYAIRICEGPVGGITRIWRDDKLVYDRRNPADWPDAAADIAALAADTAKFASVVTLYLGDETQLPDATLEGLPAENGGGIGNVPAYRGTCYAVFANDDLTDRQGTIPQYRFEVASCGEAAADSAYLLGRVFDLRESDSSTVFKSATGASWDAGESIDAGIDATHLECKGGALFALGIGEGRVSFDGGDTWQDITGFDSDTSANAVLCYVSLTTGSKIWTIYTGGLHAYKSTNGISFSQIATITDGQLSAAQASPNSGEILVGRTNGHISRSVDGGITFAAADSLLHTSGVGRLVRAGGYYVAFANAEGVTPERSPDGDDWEVTGVLAHGTAVNGAAYGGGVLVAMHDDGNTSISPDQGASWVAGGVAGSTSGIKNPNCMVYVNEAFVYTADNGIWRSTDLGQTWSQVFSGQSDASRCIAFIDQALGNEIPDLPGWSVDSEGTISGPSLGAITACSVGLDEVVADLCDRVGVTSAQIDVSQLTDSIRGFVVGRQLPAADAIRSLQQGYFFDFPEWGNYTDTSTKLRAVKRGGDALFAITDDDLIQSDDDEDARAQAVEFPRKINLISSDVDADYAPTKQTAERRTDKVKAVGEMTLELPLALRRSEAAPKADIMLKVAWTEAEGRCQFELPEDFSALTPSDVFTKSGKRWRAEKCEYGDGSVKVEAVRDRASAYTSSATAADALPPTPPIGRIRGPTVFTAMNLPALRSADNVPGMYVAGRGVLDAWVGYDLYLSVDGGLTETFVGRYRDPSVMGTLTADITSSGSPLSVSVPGGELESATTAQLAAQANAFAVGSEVGQFQTATETDTDAYDLTTLTRGLLDTTAVEHSIGDRFVLLDGTVQLLPIDIRYAGQTLIFRAVSIGTAPANNATFSVVYAPIFTSAPAIDFLETELGEVLAAESGDYLQVE